MELLHDKPAEPAELRARRKISAFSNALLDRHDQLVNRSEAARLTFCAFVFGGLMAIAMREGLSQDEINAVASALFQKGFRMPPEKSAEVVRSCIMATEAESNWSPAVNEGTEEFFEWDADAATFASHRLAKVLDSNPVTDGRTP